MRDIVIKNKNPRRLLLQANLRKENEEQINYIAYESKFGGILDSFVKDERISDDTVKNFYKIWKKNVDIMNPLNA